MGQVAVLDGKGLAGEVQKVNYSNKQMTYTLLPSANKTPTTVALNPGVDVTNSPKQKA